MPCCGGSTHVQCTFDRFHLSTCFNYCFQWQDMEEGKISPRQDLLSILINTPNDQGHLATNEEIKDNILVLLAAGHDTTSSTLAVVLKYLFLNPHCLQEVIKEQKKIAMKKVGNLLCWDDTRKMKYTWQVIQETMRIQPILTFSMRETLKEIEYGGFTIPKGWKVRVVENIFICYIS
jgi:cytochrome P450